MSHRNSSDNFATDSRAQPAPEAATPISKSVSKSVLENGREAPPEAPALGSPTAETASELEALLAVPSSGTAIHLRPNQPLRVLGRDRQPLVEVRDGEDGITLRLLSGNLELAVEGKLRISAQSLELCTSEGDAEVMSRV